MTKRFIASSVAASILMSLSLTLTPSARAFSLFKTKPTQEHTEAKQGASTAWETLSNPPFEVTVEKYDASLQEFPSSTWWKDWHDSDLNTLIDLALSQNLDIDQARLRVKEAKAITRQSLGAELPSLSLNPSINRQKNSQNLFAPSQSQLSGAGGNSSSRGGQVFAPGSTFTLYNAPIQANYELDLFFKNRLRTRSYEFQARSVQAQYQSVLTSTVSSVASSYLNWRLAQVSALLQTKLIENLTTQLHLKQALYQQGLSDYTPIQAIEQQLSTAQKENIRYQSDTRTFEYQLALLCGQTPAEFQRTKVTLNASTIESVTVLDNLLEQLPSPNTGIPSELMVRRPDIIQSENELLAAQANIQVARRELLPSINLSSSIGFTAAQFSDWFDKDSLAWSAGGSLAQSIFKGGQSIAALKERKVTYQRLLSGYQQTLLSAFQDVEKALTQLHSSSAQRQKELQKQQSLISEMNLITARYQQGLSSYLPVLEREQMLLTQKVQVSQQITNELQSRISLVKALGGGW